MSAVAYHITIGFVTCIRFVVLITLVKISWRAIEKTAKYIVQLYNSIGFFDKQTHIVLVNPIVIIVWH